MSAYVIDFSEPLKTGFSIPDGGFNGPGGSAANTTLRLYGRGAREWGEAVDEDLVRLTENFASASSPSEPTTGQVWVEQLLYYRDLSLGSVYQGWYYYDQNSNLTNKWKLVGGTGVVPSTPPDTPVEGQYYYDTSKGHLMGWFSLGRYEPFDWLARSNMTGTGAPVSPTVIPTLRLRLRDNARSGWMLPSGILANQNPPNFPDQGSLWYNTATGNLAVYTGAIWQQLLGPANNANASFASNNVNMAGFQINGLGTPTHTDDATTKAYVDSLIGGVGGFLALTGGTLTGPGNLTTDGYVHVNGVLHAYSTSVFDGAVSTGSTFHAGGQITGSAGADITGSISCSAGASIGSQLTMNNNKIVAVAAGTNANDAVNVSQMNAAIAAGGVGASVPVIWSSGTYKAGDIAIVSGVIYMAVTGGTGGPPGGGWKQVFPAVYA